MRSTKTTIGYSDSNVGRVGFCFRWLVLAALLLPEHGWALAMESELAEVPVDRIIRHLERNLTNGANQPATLYRLARLHAVSAARIGERYLYPRQEIRKPAPPSDNTQSMPRVESAPRLRGGVPETNVANDAVNWEKSFDCFRRSIQAIPQSKRSLDHQLIIPVNLAYAWAILRSGDTNAALNQFRVALKVALFEEVDGNPIDYRGTVSDSIKLHHWVGWQRQIPPRDPPYSPEIINYLLLLLDPQKDATEIRQLKSRGMPTPSTSKGISTILTPLTADGGLANLVNPTAAISFDLDGAGVKRPSGWVDARSVWLVWDPGDERHITSVMQLFGAVTWCVSWRDGYQALSALDDNNDEILDGAELEGLALWNDQNGNGTSEPDEVTSVRTAGLKAIRFNRQLYSSGLPHLPNGVSFGPGILPTCDWIPPSPDTPNR